MRRMVMASLRDVCVGGFVEASSGLEAIEQLAVGPAALMVLDLNMPDMHGIEVLASCAATLLSATSRSSS